MSEPCTREEFLTLCESEDFGTIGHILAALPAWMALNDVELAAAVWRSAWRLQASVRSERAETRATLAELKATIASYEARLASHEAWREAFCAAHETAEDDLDIFHAGYEKGYVTGWEHARDAGDDAPTN